MEIWAIVVLVVGTNLGTALIALLGNKMQLENADKRLEKQLKAQREGNQHERSWIVRSKPLLKLREEIAAMAEKLESSIDLASQFSNESTPEADKIRESLGKAVEEWDRYFESGELIKTLHMQYKHGIKLEGEKIMLQKIKMEGSPPFGGENLIQEKRLLRLSMQSRCLNGNCLLDQVCI